MTTSPASAASAVSITVRPASAALAQDALSRLSPTTTSTPESRRLLACACPWLP